MNCQDARNNVITTRQAFGRGEATVEQLYAAADAYIAALTAYKKATGNKKMRIPNRGYILRALT